MNQKQKIALGSGVAAATILYLLHLKTKRTFVTHLPDVEIPFVGIYLFDFYVKWNFTSLIFLIAPLTAGGIFVLKDDEDTKAELIDA